MTSKLIIDRVWAMPNRHTFQIKPIAQLLKEELTGGIWIDPFCGHNSPAKIKNDANPHIQADYHLDALDFLKLFPDHSVDGVLLDPPYSDHQATITYDGRRVIRLTRIYNEITRIIKPQGKVISFGWNSSGLGKKRGFNTTRILLVPHGGHHNDTIVTVEVNISFVRPT